MKVGQIDVMFFLFVIACLDAGTTGPKEKLTGSLEDLNFLNLPADVR